MYIFFKKIKLLLLNMYYMINKLYINLLLLLFFLKKVSCCLSDRRLIVTGSVTIQILDSIIHFLLVLILLFVFLYK